MRAPLKALQCDPAPFDYLSAIELKQRWDWLDLVYQQQFSQICWFTNRTNDACFETGPTAVALAAGAITWLMMARLRRQSTTCVRLPRRDLVGYGAFAIASSVSAGVPP
jgi:hypothetical protein